MLRAGTTGTTKCWHGVLRDKAGEIVWQCEHSHRNRDHGSTYYSAAKACAENELHRRGLKTPDSVQLCLTN